VTWSIDPGAARGVLDRAVAHVPDVDTAASAHSIAVDAASTAALHAPATQAALGIVGADPLMKGIAAARRYIEQVVLTVDEVIAIYDRGDLEMALETQRQVPGEPQ
jgi:hypothetical protein